MNISAKLPPKLRKAAILISTLDTASADKLLDQMSPEQSARVRLALMELEDINASEQETIIREFLGGQSPQSPIMDDGVELDPSLLRQLANSPAPTAEPSTPKIDEEPFQFLNDASSESIGRLLQRQHPQIAAVVLSHLSPQKAVNVLVLFAPALQTEVLRRVAELDSADPEVLRDLEAELQSLFSAELRPSGVRSTGLTAVQSILRAAQGNDRSDILANLQQRDGDLAKRLQRAASDVAAPVHSSSQADTLKFSSVGTRSTAQPIERALTAAAPAHETKKGLAGPVVDVTFADVTQLSSADLARLFHRCDPQVTLLALTGAEETFVERLLAQLPLRDAKLLRRRMQQLGPILLRDVERAQQKLAEVAARMVAERELSIEPRSFAAAA